jgi:hypothetical protein
MPRSPVRFVKTFATRLGPSDIAKLKALCSATNTTPSELFRVLINAAQPTGVPLVVFASLEESKAEGDDWQRK